MAERSKAMPFEPEKSGTAHKSLPQKGSKSPKIKKPKATSSSQQAIPKPVANRMLRRVIFASGLPPAAGMGVFVVSYLIVSRGIADISPFIT
ncbi:MAG: photosystem II biosynthesis protein, partial [Cyanobacteriota bacterium]|nr:photosystem II biosynthesis protein [Cyanobacteriota bacterium]